MSRARRVIVVFGCPVGAGGAISPALARRLTRAREEAARDPAALLLVSGGVVHGQPEAPFMREWLVTHGVASERVRVEPAARDTEENAVLSAAALRGEAVSDVLLVTDRFHMRRSRILLAIALRRAFGHRAVVVEASVEDNKRWLERLGLAVSEAVKLLWSLSQMLWRCRPVT